MFTNFDCDAFWVADRAALIRSLSVLPEYLRNQATESGAVIDYRDWQIPLGRRFRALKLWMVIRHYGVEGLRFHVRRHVELAQAFASWVEEDPDFELSAPVPLNLVCFPPPRRRRRQPSDHGPTERLRRALPHPHQARGRARPAHVDRPGSHRGTARRAGVGAPLAKLLRP